jgi:hypothetical protein
MSHVVFPDCDVRDKLIIHHRGTEPTEKPFFYQTAHTGDGPIAEGTSL